MELTDIIKAAKEKELGADIIAGIEALDQSGEVERLKGELTAEQGKSGGILEDKKRYKAERDAHKAALDAIETDKLPAEEKHEKAMKELQAKLDKQQANSDKREADYAKAQRDSTVSDLTGSIKWSDGVPQGTAKLAVQAALAGIDDLSDKTKVDAALKAVTESHKSMIAAAAPAGSGDKPDGGGGGGGDKTKFTLKDSVDEAWPKT